MPANQPIDIGHAALLPIVARLEEVADFEQAVETLRRLQTALPGHFQAEEGPDGLFERVREGTPRMDLAVRRLEKEHEDLLETLTSLDLRLRALSADLAGFARRIRVHESEENALLNESLCTDLGGGD